MLPSFVTYFNSPAFSVNDPLMLMTSVAVARANRSSPCTLVLGVGAAFSG